MIDMAADATMPGQRSDGDRVFVGLSPSDQVDLAEDVAVKVDRNDQVGWILRLTDLWTEHGLSLDVVRRAASGLAWRAREAGLGLPGTFDGERIAAHPQPRRVRLALAYLEGVRLKVDFRFEELERRVQTSLSEHPHDAMLHALAAFAALGQRSDRALPILERTKALPNYDWPCRAICAQGIWLASHIPDQADWLLALTDDMIGRGEENENLFYWRAAGLRMQGRFDEALYSIDRAIDRLPTGMNNVHQDYVREREMIAQARSLQAGFDEMHAAMRDDMNAKLAAHLEEMERRATEHVQSAQRVVSESLLRTVEILALFVALIGFLITSGAVVVNADSIGQSVVAIALLGAGAIGFFVVLRVVVRLERKPRTEGKGWRLN